MCYWKKVIFNFPLKDNYMKMKPIKNKPAFGGDT